ncbi:MAG: DUF2484 family protein [Rhodobacteraceae bacterium]|nr:DUF2484 family protein [Paracoccaceae bacterium]
MMQTLGAAALWYLVATVIAMMPSRDHHWRAAKALILTGLPILVAVFWQNGPWVGLLVLAGGMSVLRWPLVFLVRWLRGQSGG